jgi:aspartyl-tRNA(Asn)/glutamyl-tRNA(Gln) amidotransferase subunit C
MQIDDQLLNKLSKLSHIAIDDDKREDLKKELASIVGFVENIQDVDTDGIDATVNILAEVSKDGTQLREDKEYQDLDFSNHILSHAPKSNDNFFIVPKIIE